MRTSGIMEVPWYELDFDCLLVEQLFPSRLARPDELPARATDLVISEVWRGAKTGQIYGFLRQRVARALAKACCDAAVATSWSNVGQAKEFSFASSTAMEHFGLTEDEVTCFDAGYRDEESSHRFLPGDRVVWAAGPVGELVLVDGLARYAWHSTWRIVVPEGAQEVSR